MAQHYFVKLLLSRVNPEGVLALNLLWLFAFLCHYLSEEHELKNLIKDFSIELTRDLRWLCVKEINTTAFVVKRLTNQ